MRHNEPIRVVVVDDEDDMRRLFRLALSYDDRFEVVGEAADGDAAAALAVTVQPEAVVLDWAMPRVSGAEAVVAIKARVPACTVVVVSAYDRAEIETAAEALGADGYLDKPTAAELLPSLLLRLCREEVDLRDPAHPAPSHPDGG